MAKKRGKGTFVKSRTASFEDDRRPLKRCGEVHRLYCSFSPQVRRDLLNDIGLSHLRRVGHRRKVELLRRATTIDADFLAIDEFVCSRDQRLGVTMSGAVFGPRLTQMLEQAIKILGSLGPIRRGRLSDSWKPCAIPSRSITDPSGSSSSWPRLWKRDSPVIPR